MPNARPETIIGQLPPTPRVGDRALVDNTTSKVDHDSDEEDDGKNTARPYTTGLGWLNAGAGMLAAYDEQICAFVWVGADKRHERSGVDTFAVAAEGKCRRFPPRLLSLLDQYFIVLLYGHGIERATISTAVVTAILPCRRIVVGIAVVIVIIRSIACACMNRASLRT